MSTVRMCDIGGEIFSERQDGWQTYVATNVRRNRTTGAMETMSEQLDACPLHATGPLQEGPAPRLMGGKEAKQLRKGKGIKDTLKNASDNIESHVNRS